MLSKKLEEGLTLHRKGELDKAKKIYEQILIEDPKHLDAIHLLGIIYFQFKDYERAIHKFLTYIDINPNNAPIYLDLGNSQFCLQKYNDAIISFKKAINIKPDFSEVYNSLGNVFLKLKKLKEAEKNFNKALSINPNYIEALNNYGSLLDELKKFDNSIECFKKAISLNPNYYEAYNNLGIALKQISKYEEAQKIFEKSISLRPNQITSYINLGNLLLEIKKEKEALDNFSKAISIDTNYNSLFGAYLSSKMAICDWDNFYENIEKYRNLLSKNKYNGSPFISLQLLDNPELHNTCSKNFINNFENIQSKKIFLKKNLPKIKIAYFSADFREHPVAYLITEVLKNHDKNEFEVYGFYFGPENKDLINSEISISFKRYFDVRLKNDDAITKISRDLEIDIAIDLNGYTTFSRPKIFFNQAASIQVNFLGYPGTLGTKYYDYIISDKNIIPTELQKNYEEKIAYLPKCWLPKSIIYEDESFNFKKKDFNLPEDKFIFCCFHNNNKILPETFDCWIDILKKTNHGILWLLENNSEGTKNLKNEAKKRNINPDRLIFSRKLEPKKHISRCKLSDLFLDTFPYNGHGSSSDMLKIGVPIITREGFSFASRVGSSLLKNLNLDELVTRSAEEYTSLAIEIGNNTKKFFEIKEKLKKNLNNFKNYNNLLYTKDLEKCYKTMISKYLNGKEPDHIYI